MTRDSRTDAPRSSLRIRRASPADAEGIARLHHLSHTTSFAAFAPAAWVATRELDAYRRVWRDRLDAADAFSAAWVAVDGDDVVGLVSVSRMPEDGEGGRPVAAIRSVHVHPRWIGRGIGRELWTCVRSFLRDRGFATATLDTIAGNARARRFFEAGGCRLARIAPDGVEGVPIAVYELGVAAPDDAKPRGRPAAQDGGA